MKSVKLRVTGMTCGSCVARVEKAALGIPGVQGAHASLEGGNLTLLYEERRFDRAALDAALEAAGYAPGAGIGGKAWSLGIGALLAAAYLLASARGLFNSFPAIESGLGYGMLLLAGLLTSVHCVAMCGGLALSQSIPRAAVAAPEGGGPRAAAEPGLPGGRLGVLAPGLAYNAGRVLSYTLVGGLVGALGAALDFSPTAQGLITGLAGMFMLVLGLGALGILPPLPSLSGLLPARAAASLGRLRAQAGGRASGTRKPLVVGLLNGLMPCGPLQTMQLYALGTGSALAGAFSMFLFSVGTVPLMLGFGLVASLLPRRLAPALSRASAVLVLALGTATMGRAAGLAGIAPPLPAAHGALAAETASAPAVSDITLAADTKDELKATIEKGIQTVITEIGSNYYPPFLVQSGIPLRWIIRVRKENLNGCNRTLIVPAWKLRKGLVPGDNLVEIPASALGAPGSSATLPFSCWMGMIRSAITVVPDMGAVASPRS